MSKPHIRPMGFSLLTSIPASFIQGCGIVSSAGLCSMQSRERESEREVKRETLQKCTRQSASTAVMFWGALPWLIAVVCSTGAVHGEVAGFP